MFQYHNNRTYRAADVKPCKYCGEKIQFNQELNAWMNYEDGLLHKDKRPGTAIDAIDERTQEILRQLELLRKAVWEVGQTVNAVRQAQQ